jgi:lipopolysaccharide export system permease protein
MRAPAARPAPPAPASAYPAPAPRRAVRLSATLSFYLARQVALGIGIALFTLAALALVIDIIELLRRASGHPQATLGVVLLLAGLHLPFLVQKLTPFAVLFGTMLCFVRLTRSHELVATRAMGVSVWQFLLPALLVALLLGGIVVTAFNPLAAATVARYERLETAYLAGGESLVAAAPAGLWLRQTKGDEEILIHARHMLRGSPPVLQSVMVVTYEDGNRFAGRIDVPEARLEPGRLELIEPVITRPDGLSELRDRLTIPTDITPDRIQESFAPPETLSFWDLPAFIDGLEAVGFSAREHRLYWQGLLALPLLLCAMLLIGTTFSLRLVRRGGTGLLVTTGVVTGLAFYVLADVVFAIGLSGRLPVVPAAWIPAGVAVLLGLTSLLHLEDG